MTSLICYSSFRYSLRDYLCGMCKVAEYNEVITVNLNTMVKFLIANPKYNGIHIMKIDMNVIEVLHLLNV